MTIYRFGEFELDPTQRRLSKGESVVRIGARAFDVLACLVANAGQTLSKDEIIKSVWPTTHVDEAALRVHMVALRKAIHDGTSPTCIVNIPGVGYKFAKPVSKTDHNIPAEAELPIRQTLPANHARLIGREEFINRSVELMDSARLLTITGPGGIGKTSAAIAIARALEGQFDQLFFLDLATLSSSDLVTSEIASSLGLSVFSADPLPGIIQSIGRSRALFVFDNCEHVIDVCATVIEQLLRLTPNAAFIATSREALRVVSENVRKLPSLAVPEADEVPDTIEAYAALELFHERLALVGGQGLRQPEDLPIAAEIVRRLDGIPLAIELAASRAAGLGLQNTASSLSNPINALRRGRRTAPPRQQTLKATLKWSYDLLLPEEQILLCHLSAFAGPFNIAAASALSPKSLGPETFEDALAGLISKSLISTTRRDGRMRLLEMTRAFAREQLEASGQMDACGLSHALWVIAELEHAKAEWRQMEKADWMNAHGDLIHDVRAALAWCCKSESRALCLQISAISHILWTQLGLMNEELQVVERAVRLMEEGTATDPLIEAQLRSAMGHVLFHVRGVTADDEAVRQFKIAGDIAEDLGDHVEIVRAHSGRCAVITTQGKYAEAVDVALRLEHKFGRMPGGASSRILAMNKHFLGEHEEMNRLCHLALEASSKTVGRTTTSGAGYDQRTVALMLMAKTAWIQGFGTRAIELAEEAVAEALNNDDAISTCLAIYVSAFPVYFGQNKLETARHLLDLLRELAIKHSISRSLFWADGFEPLFDEPSGNRQRLEAAFVGDTNGARLETVVVLAGKRSGSALVDWALESNAGWCRPELIRLKGELLRDEHPEEARRLFSAAIDASVAQGSPLWHLRAAKSLAASLGNTGRNEGQRLINAALATFPEPPPPCEMEEAEALLDA
ncbi:ATP-binding protein [Rhizobium oryzicola]|uniref:Winged helix-turn-helix domain-containing protein n=1 Tax=Rhizobium oryzicola TaxID=1232668 RepID=A0ABT8SZL8_9HYPH|nr:winged helix-turn-helix domain-containing protein [Rhizobium oryzicola]MDO1583431.1 winged helix-turn-helix domain-containing protein [Rhizobium oryzicola]